MALNETEVRRQRRLVSEVEGLRLQGVRYVDLDYGRERHAPDAVGPRLIVDEDEWLLRTWRGEACDSVDWGVEFQLESNRIFAVTWEPPGPAIEGILLLREQLVGGAVSRDVWAAVWDVGERSNWRALLGQSIAAVNLRYAPWGNNSERWLPRITMVFANAAVELLLGELTMEWQKSNRRPTTSP